MKAIIISLTCSGLLLGLSACESDGADKEKDPTPFKKIQLAPRQQEVKDCVNQLGFNVFEKLDHEATTNVVFSPLSLGMSWGMVANAANGSTQQAAIKAMGLTPENATEINSTCRKYLDGLPSIDKATEISLAQAIGVLDAFPLKAEFVTSMATWFDAPVQQKADYADLTSAVNHWVEEVSKGNISHFLPETLDVKYALCSALYFNGKWASGYSFEKSKTSVATFCGLSKSSQVSMMYQNNDMQGADNQRFASATIPFGNHNFAFTVVLPKKENGILGTADFSKALDAANHFYNVTLQLPKFKIDEGDAVDLIPALKGLGAGECFLEGADYSGMFQTEPEEMPGLSFVMQKTTFEINEDGAKATAATASGEMLMSEAHPALTLVVDRPFYFFLTEQSTGAILIAGHITDL